MFKPYSYQTQISDDATKILIDKKIVILSMQVRTGKSVTALMIAEKYGAKKVLFVSKKKALKSIQSDYDLMKPDFELCVVNYESVHKVEFIPDLIICDESHCLGAFPKPSGRAKMMKEIIKKKPMILLSGTLTPESFSQIYHQFWISGNTPFKLWTSFYKWSHDFVNIKKKYVYNREINDYSDSKIDKIEQFTKPYIISFTQKEAGFNREVKENVLNCDMIPGIGQLIDILNRDLVYEMKNGALILADTAVKLQNKIHQISSGTVKDENGEYHILDRSKAYFIRDYFKGKKIAVFYKFKAEFALLKTVLSNCTESPEEFQKSDNMTFLGQFQSAREGVRLDTADALIFYNIDFSFLSYEQGKNRIMSKDRTEEAPMYFIFNRNGIEPKIYKLVIAKRDFTTYYFKKSYGIKNELFRSEDTNNRIEQIKKRRLVSR